MADNIIKVNVTASKPKSVTVSSSQVGTEITASSDTGKFWAQTAKNWAVSDFIVDNTDYSSKYYANKAKGEANSAKNFAEASANTYQNLQETSEETLNTLETKTQEAIDTIALNSEQVISNIETTEKDVLENIETTTEANKKEIKDLADVIKDSAEDIIGRVGFNMFDTILKDHVLTYEESKGLALQGTYVYKEAVAGSRYGYADFYNKVVEEYNNSTDEYITQKFVQPKLISDGVMGGNTFAVYTNVSQYGTSKAYNAFDSIASSLFHSASGVITGYIDMYNPKPLNITNIQITNQGNANRASSAGIIYGSNNGEDWEEIITYTNTVQTASATWNIDLASNTKYYNYYRLESTAGSTGGYWTITEINLTATEALAAVKKNSNGHLFYNITEKDKVDEVFNQFGIAWFYGVDTENERVFLPRNNWFEQVTGDIAEVGRSVEAGLPNITATNLRAGQDGNPTGAFYKQNSGQDNLGASNYGSDYGFDASRSNPIYGNSDTVQPASVKKLLYICVGNTESTSSVTDVVEVTTTENDTMPLFAPMYFDFTPNNVSWLKGGEQKNSGGVYTFCYNELVNELTTPKYGLKVIETKDMIVGVDYSEYWKINQDDMTFTTPTAISNKALSGAVVGNGMNLGITNGDEFGAFIDTGNANTIGVQSQMYGQPVGTTPVSGVLTASKSYGVTTDPTKSGIIAEQSTAQLYFKVANAVQNLELLNAGEVMEAVADKISRQDCKSYVTETYQNGTSWYRIWSDGWCEQGGFGNNVNTITLLKSFINTNYTIQVSKYMESTTDNSVVNITGKTTSQFTISRGWLNGAGIAQVYWQACGYIA
jgi:predicted transcriptional regulator YheO